MKHLNGFTLIELMITLVIVGILTSIAYPSYAHYLVKVNRLKAEQNLYTLAHDMEHYYEDHKSYLGVTLEDLPADRNLKDTHYTYQITELTDNSFELSAIPTGNQAKYDHDCGQLNLDQLGDHSGSSENQSDCW